MNHPKPEEWVRYIYGEAPSTTRRELAAHLSDCPQCREEIETWKRSLNRLDRWQLPKTQPAPVEWLAPFVKWAAAAAILLAAGILIGRATVPKVDMEKLRATIAPEIQRDLNREMSQLVRQEVAKAASLTLTSSHRYSEQVGQQVYVMLKKDVDTVAVNAAAGLRSTAQQLVELADYKEPQISGAPSR
jgi:anti-sigma factor RsiW